MEGNSVMTSKVFGYMRVSTTSSSKDEDGQKRDKQNFDMQWDALIAYGVQPDDIYQERASGKKNDRPQLAACIKNLRKGDTLVVWRLDRLGRNTLHLIKTILDITNDGVIFKTLTGVQIDTTTPTGKFALTLFAALAELEADQTHERVMAGLAAARARGRVGGRPAALTPAKLRLAQAAMTHRDTSVTKLCDELDISVATLYNYVTPDGTLRAPGEKLLRKAA